MWPLLMIVKWKMGWAPWMIWMGPQWEMIRMGISVSYVVKSIVAQVDQENMEPLNQDI